MKNKKFLLSILAIVLLGAGIYAYLGGFNQPEIQKAMSERTYIAGEYFEGSVKSEAMGELFQKAGKLADDNVISGVLGNVLYNDPEKSNDSIRAFIGLIVPDSAVKLPEGYSVRVMPAGKPVLRVAVKAHYMLAPGKIYPALVKYANENNLKLQDVYVEQFPSSKEAIVTAFLK